jgi:hypothetical protein
MWNVERKMTINSGSVKRKYMREDRHKPLVLRPSCAPEKVGVNQNYCLKKKEIIENKTGQRELNRKK